MKRRVRIELDVEGEERINVRELASDLAQVLEFEGLEILKGVSVHVAAVHYSESEVR